MCYFNVFFFSFFKERLCFRHCGLQNCSWQDFLHNIFSNTFSTSVFFPPLSQCLYSANYDKLWNLSSQLHLGICHSFTMFLYVPHIIERSFCISVLASLSIIFSRSIHVTAICTTSSFVMAEQYSPVSWPLGLLQILGIVTSSAMNKGVQMFF